MAVIFSIEERGYLLYDLSKVMRVLATDMYPFRLSKVMVSTRPVYTKQQPRAIMKRRRATVIGGCLVACIEMNICAPILARMKQPPMTNSGQGIYLKTSFYLVFSNRSLSSMNWCGFCDISRSSYSGVFFLIIL